MVGEVGWSGRMAFLMELKGKYQFKTYVSGIKNVHS